MFTCLLNAEHDNDGQILLVCTSVVMCEEQQTCMLDADMFLKAPVCVISVDGIRLFKENFR